MPEKTFNLITIPNIFVDKVSEQVSGFKMQEKSSGFDGICRKFDSDNWDFYNAMEFAEGYERFLRPGLREWSSQRFFEAIPDDAGPGGPGPDHTKICRHLDVAIVGKVVFVFVVYDPS